MFHDVVVPEGGTLHWRRPPPGTRSYWGSVHSSAGTPEFLAKLNINAHDSPQVNK